MFSKHVNATTRVSFWDKTIVAADIPGARSMVGPTFLIRSGFDSLSVGADHRMSLAIVNSKVVEHVSRNGDQGGIASGNIFASWIVGSGKDMDVCETRIAYESPDQWADGMHRLLELMCGVKERTRVELTVREYIGLPAQVKARLRMIAHYSWPVAAEHIDSKVAYNDGADFAEVCKWSTHYNFYALSQVEKYTQADESTRTAFVSGMADAAGNVHYDEKGKKSGQYHVTFKGGAASNLFRKITRGLGIQTTEETVWDERKRHTTIFKIEGCIRGQKDKAAMTLQPVKVQGTTLYKFTVAPMSAGDVLVAYDENLPVKTIGGLAV